MISRPPLPAPGYKPVLLLRLGNAGTNGICGLGIAVPAFSCGNVFGVLLTGVLVCGCFAFLFGYGHGRLCGAWG